MADKFTLFEKSGNEPDSGTGSSSYDDGFFDEFSFDDFDYDDIFGSDSDEFDFFEPIADSEKDDKEPLTQARPAQSKPAQPKVSTQPAQPKEQNRPVQPKTPSRPAQPAQPAQSAQPKEQNRPIQPKTPSRPAQPAQPKTPSQPAQPKAVSRPVQQTVKTQTPAGKTEESRNPYESMMRDKDSLVPKNEIEPDDPMLSEFESALAAEIQRVTKEQEAEKKRKEALRATRHAVSDSAARAAEEKNARSRAGGESIRSGGWARRRRGQSFSEYGSVQEPSQMRSSGQTYPQKEIGHVDGGRIDEEFRAQEEARRLAREQERARAAAARAERVKAAKAAQAEAERQAAIAREREAEIKRRDEAARAAKEAEERKAREEAERIAREKAALEEKKRKELEEEAARKALAEKPVAKPVEKTSEKKVPDDEDEEDDDDDEGSRGRTVITVSVIMVLLLLGVGAAMTYFWSNLSVNRPQSNSNNPAAVASQVESNTEAATAEAENTMTPEESRYLDQSRAAQAKFEEEQKAALARAAELEEEERTAKMEEAGMEGLPDISTRDLSEYLTEMPAEGASICTTETALYSYDQMVKDLYFLTVRYGDYIGMGIIGNTLDERAIYQAVIGNANASQHIVVYYGLDAVDYIDTVLAMNQLEVYCKDRKNGTAYKSHSIDSIFEDVCIHVIPMANPDGISVCQYGLDALRTEEARAAVQAAYDADVAAGLTTDPIETYLTKYSANAAGVDLNCNFDSGWEEYTEGPDAPSASGYKGTAAFSEAETQALMNIVDSVNTAAVIGYSTSGNTVNYGYGYEGSADQGVEGVTEIGVEGLVSSISAKTGYESTEIAAPDASSTGGAAAYFLNEKDIPAIVIETGSGESPLDIVEMSSIWNANSAVLQMLGNLYTNGL